jgi:four helix bundle protein
MDIRDFAKELEKRSLRFAIKIIRLSASLPNSPEARVVRTQITKCGSSVGAHYREANRSRSKADFKNKIAICESEASETQFWLNVIIEVGWKTKEQVSAECEECSELLAIFTSIGKK